MRTVGTIIVVALLLAVITAPSGNTAPPQEKGIVYYVAKAGLAASNVVGKDRQAFDLDPSARMGGTAGVGLGYAFNEKFLFQPELMLTSKGYNINGDENTLYSQFYFMEMPLLFKMRSTAISDIKPSIYLGPVFSYKMSGDSWADNANPSLASSTTDELLALAHHEEDSSPDFDYGVTAGIDMHSFSSNIVVDFRYTMGLRKMAADGDRDIRHSNFTVTFGYAF